MSIVLLLRILPFLLAALIGFGGAWKIQDVRIDSLKVALKQAGNDLKACQGANKTNRETIGNLRKEIAQADKTCTERLRINSKKTGRIRQIDELPPYMPNKENKGGKGDEKISTIAATDALLDELNSMFDNSAASNKDGIHKTAGSGASGKTGSLSCQMAGGGYTEAVRFYCLDVENVKNLLKNREIDKAYQDELRAILEGAR